MEENQLIYIEDYSVFWRIEEHSGSVHLLLSNGSSQDLNINNVMEGLFLLNILQNEKPLFYDDEHKLIITHGEQ